MTQNIAYSALCFMAKFHGIFFKVGIAPPNGDL